MDIKHVQTKESYLRDLSPGDLFRSASINCGESIMMVVEDPKGYMYKGKWAVNLNTGALRDYILEMSVIELIQVGSLTVEDA